MGSVVRLPPESAPKAHSWTLRCWFCSDYLNLLFLLCDRLKKEKKYLRKGRENLSKIESYELSCEVRNNEKDCKFRRNKFKDLHQSKKVKEIRLAQQGCPGHAQRKVWKRQEVTKSSPLWWTKEKRQTRWKNQKTCKKNQQTKMK